MYELIKAGNYKVLKHLSICIHKAFEIRNNTMYVDNRIRSIVEKVKHI